VLPARKPQRSQLPQLRNVAVAAVLFGITTADGLIAFYENGRGPLAALPLVAQMIIFLIGEDFILYWSHRLFHGHALWKCHAVLHSSEDLEWISAARFHPSSGRAFAAMAAAVMPPGPTLKSLRTGKGCVIA
jgi:sterol desaturase/sphingolipid hydroxylase (fatty acid hydroxylase superfamily)